MKPSHQLPLFLFVLVYIVASSSLSSSQGPEGALIGQINVHGNTVLHEEIDQMIEEFQGEDLRRDDIQKKIRKTINKMYLEHGYLTSRVSALVFENDILTIQILEGSLDKIIVEDESELWLRPSYLRERIQFGARSPLSMNELENHLRLLRIDPLIEHVEASLKPTGKGGKTNLSMRIKEANPLIINLMTDNYSPPSIGEFRYGFAVGHRNLTGHGDQLDGSYYRTTTGGAHLLDFSYRIPLNAMNGTLRLRGAQYWTKVTQSEFSNLDLEGDKEVFAVHFRQPFVRTLKHELAFSLGFTYQKGQTFIFENIGTPFGIGPEANGVSRTSVLTLGQEYIHRSPKSTWFLGSQLNFGTKVFDATENSGAIPDGQFFNWLGQVQLAQWLGDDHLWITSGDLQLTPDGLLASEQFVIGGVYSVRGYRQNARIGDNGFHFSTEDRITLLSDKAGRPWFQIVPFVDMGRTWNVSDNPNPQSDQRFLIGAGLGLLIEPFRDFKVRVDYGFPFIDLDDKGDDVQDNGFYFSVGYQPQRFIESIFSASK